MNTRMDLEFWRSQLQQRHRNLQKLKEQLALYGNLDAPLRLLNQIGAEEQKIAEIEAKLKDNQESKPSITTDH